MPMIPQTDSDTACHPVQKNRDRYCLPRHKEQSGNAPDVHRYHPCQHDPVDVSPVQVATPKHIVHVGILLTLRAFAGRGSGCRTGCSSDSSVSQLCSHCFFFVLARPWSLRQRDWVEQSWQHPFIVRTARQLSHPNAKLLSHLCHLDARLSYVPKSQNMKVPQTGGTIAVPTLASPQNIRNVGEKDHATDDSNCLRSPRRIAAVRLWHAIRQHPKGTHRQGSRSCPDQSAQPDWPACSD